MQESIVDIIKTKKANRQEERSVSKDDIMRCSINGSSEKSLFSDRSSNESTGNEMRTNIVKEEFIDSEEYRKSIEESSTEAYDI